jgi:hypothetical protein
MNSYEKGAVICRAALAKGPLVLQIKAPSSGCVWVFGKRAFSPNTVRWLIDRGEAVREGNIVRAA